jgi:hypothetical protein
VVLNNTLQFQSFGTVSGVVGFFVAITADRDASFFLVELK